MPAGELVNVDLSVNYFRVPVATTGSMLIVRTGIFTTEFANLIYTELCFKNDKSAFKPDLIEELGQGGFAKVFKAKFHGKYVAMKYIPLDKVKNGYEFAYDSYGCHEYYFQEQFTEFCILLKTLN